MNEVIVQNKLQFMLGISNTGADVGDDQRKVLWFDNFDDLIVAFHTMQDTIVSNDFLPFVGDWCFRKADNSKNWINLIMLDITEKSIIMGDESKIRISAWSDMLDTWQIPE